MPNRVVGCCQVQEDSTRFLPVFIFLWKPFSMYVVSDRWWYNRADTSSTTLGVHCGTFSFTRSVTFSKAQFPLQRVVCNLLQTCSFQFTITEISLLSCYWIVCNKSLPCCWNVLASGRECVCCVETFIYFFTLHPSDFQLLYYTTFRLYMSWCKVVFKMSCRQCCLSDLSATSCSSLLVTSWNTYARVHVYS